MVFSVHAHLNHAYFELFESFCTGREKGVNLLFFAGNLTMVLGSVGIGLTQELIFMGTHRNA